MALAPSTLSRAADGLAKLVQTHFGQGYFANIDTPAAAAETAKDGKPFVNLFFYRIAPSAFHPGRNTGDPLFVRLFCLVTPFAKPADQDTDKHPELTLLSEVIRLFESGPVLAPAAPEAGETAYRLEAVLLSPDMEEINHIWTTQGNDVPYRLSAAFEFSLTPIEALNPRGPAPPVRAAQLQVDPDLKARDLAEVPFREGHRVVPLANAAHPGPAWLPSVLLRTDTGALVPHMQLPATAVTLPLVVAGPPGKKVLLTLTWTTAAGAVVAPTAPETTTKVVTIKGHALDAPAAREDVPIVRPATAKALTIRAEAANNAGNPVPDTTAAHILQVRFP